MNSLDVEWLAEAIQLLKHGMHRRDELALCTASRCRHPWCMQVLCAGFTGGNGVRVPYNATSGSHTRRSHFGGSTWLNGLMKRRCNASCRQALIDNQLKLIIMCQYPIYYIIFPFSRIFLYPTTYILLLFKWHSLYMPLSSCVGIDFLWGAVEWVADLFRHLFFL